MKRVYENRPMNGYRIGRDIALSVAADFRAGNLGMRTSNRYNGNSRRIIGDKDDRFSTDTTYQTAGRFFATRLSVRPSGLLSEPTPKGTDIVNT